MTELIFIFAYFTGNGENGMRLAASKDGLIWENIPGIEYVIAPDSGLMRDPFLLLGPDDQFHLIWTTDWEAQNIGYASSTNLIDWTKQSRIPVMEGHPNTRNCWAPEMVYDSEKSEYLLYWASTVPGMFPETQGSSESDYNHRMWATTTQDFSTISEPKIFFDPGFNVIDITLLRDSTGSIRLIGKDERLTPEKKNLFVSNAESYHGPFSAPGKPFTKSWVEGPATLQIGEWTYVYYDVYREKRYEAMRTKDFVNWEDLSEEVSFPQGARHGSIVSLSRERYNELGFENTP